MNNRSRTYNVIVNSGVGIIATVSQVLINYVVRIILVRELGAEINGLHNLFQSLVNIMTLMEAGFGTAMVVHLYQPISNRDENKIRKIVVLYRTIYLYIGIIFFIGCMFVDIFIVDKIMTTTIPFNIVKIYFMLFALSFALYYVTYYKRSILFAEQKNRISIAITSICELVFRGTQILVILWTHNYVLFLILMIVEKLMSNIICNIYINYNHPYLLNLKGVSPDIGLRKKIFDTVKPLLVYNISTTAQQSARSILVSMLLGNIIIVGKFGNYQLISGAGQLLFSQFGGAITSAFGNLAASDNREALYHVYMKVSYLLNWGAIIFSAGFLTCIQDFITLTFGAEYLLPLISVSVLVADMLVYLFNIPIISIQNAMGLHNKDKNYMVIQAISAISGGYILGNNFGMNGILMGLLIPQMIFTLYHKGMIVYKYVFDKTNLDYMGFMSKELLKAGAVIYIVHYVCSYIYLHNHLLNFLVKGVVSVLISIVLMVVISVKNRYFQEILTKLKSRVYKGENHNEQ